MEAMAERPLFEDPEVHAKRWFILGVMCLSLVLVVMSVSGLNVAIPTIQRELGASNTDLQWIIDAYGLVFAGVLLTAGAIGDRYGRKGALLAGLGIFAGGALLGGLADSPSMVIFGRCITGFGAAFVMPATLSIITTVFPPHERRKAIATWAGFAGAGGAIGPIVSGALLEWFWWGSALLFNVPVVAAIAVAVWMFAPGSRDAHAPRLDPLGAALSLIGISALVFGIIEGPVKGWSSALVIASFVVAVLALALFVAWELRTRNPMLPMELFRDRRFSVGSGVVTLAFFVMFGFFFVFTQYTQFVRGYSPLLAGVATLPLAFTLVLVSPRSAALAERFGSGVVIAAGFVSVAAGFALLATIDPSSPYIVLALALVLLAAGMGVTTAPATGSIMSAVPPAKAGVGSAVNDTTRELGGALGIAVLGSIINATYRSSVDLDGLPLPPAAREGATESIGVAGIVARQVPGAGELAARAGDAFTHAFNVTSLVSAAIALAAAALVVTVFRPGAERRASAADEQHGPVPVAAEVA